MRGKDQAVKKSTERTRITPAYAGKRNRRERKLAMLEDHPRLCGEKSFSLPSTSGQIGSPPPMRGKGNENEKLQYVKQDHPRLCGEKCPRINTGIPMLGSPPPMRGKVRMHEGKLAMDRITPAYAGKSKLKI